jgi:hypothetical protein
MIKDVVCLFLIGLVVIVYSERRFSSDTEPSWSVDGSPVLGEYGVDSNGRVYGNATNEANGSENGGVERLRAELAEFEERLKMLSEELQAIALDERVSGPERREAVLLISKIGDEGSLAFLATHLGEIRIDPPFGRSGADGRTLEWACYAAWLQVRDWNAVPAILDNLMDFELTEDRLPWTLNFSARLIRDRLGRDAAKALIESELHGATEERHRENLEEVFRLIGR